VRVRSATERLRRVVLWPVLLVVTCLAIGPLAAQQNKAIVMRIDGRSVESDPPPSLVDGAVYLPASPLLDGLGAEREWDAETKAITARLPRTTAEFVLLKAEAKRNGQVVEAGLAVTVVAGKAFIPARLAAKALDLEVKWDEERRLVEITSIWTKRPVTISEILRWPRYLRGKAFTVTGEYRGWLPGGGGPALEKGRPKRHADWVLRDDGGALYVSGRSPAGLDPLDDVGRVVVVHGTGGLTGDGIPFIEAEGVEVLATPESAHR